MPDFRRDTHHRFLFINDLCLSVWKKRCLEGLYLGPLAHMYTDMRDAEFQRIWIAGAHGNAGGGSPADRPGGPCL